MERESIIICFGCRERITVEDIRSGRHDHADLDEAHYDAAVNNGGD